MAYTRRPEWTEEQLEVGERLDAALPAERKPRLRLIKGGWDRP